jgi:ubiquinone/menaquinone biosynthesis C-methylase UbiE
LNTDKQIELDRYDVRARSTLSNAVGTLADVELGSASMPHYLRTPYVCYEMHAKSLITSQHKVLELGAGSGLHSWALVQSGAQVICTDISPNSLKVLAHQYASRGIAVETQVADIEKLPFPDDSFDVVASAGCLSYGQPALVDTEIRRVLRAGGMFICVDSLNHNPIYRLNRLLHL